MADTEPATAAVRAFGQTRECHFCHRIGSRGFVPMGDYGWACANDRACNRRQTRA